MRGREMPVVGPGSDADARSGDRAGARARRAAPAPRRAPADRPGVPWACVGGRRRAAPGVFSLWEVGWCCGYMFADPHIHLREQSRARDHLPSITPTSMASARRHPGQARHGHDLSADRHHELGTGGEPHLAHRDDVVRRRALGIGVGREAVLGLGDADREIAVPHLLELRRAGRAPASSRRRCPWRDRSPWRWCGSSRGAACRRGRAA